MKNSKGITLIALIITIIVMIILVAVTVNVALNGGLFGKAETATTKTTREIEKENLISAMVGGVQAGGKFDITKVTLPDGANWITSKDNTTEVASPNTSGNWVLTSTGNIFYVDKNGNVSDEQPTSTITFEPNKALGKIAFNPTLKKVDDFTNYASSSGGGYEGLELINENGDTLNVSLIPFNDNSSYIILVANFNDGNNPEGEYKSYGTYLYAFDNCETTLDGISVTVDSGAGWYTLSIDEENNVATLAELTTIRTFEGYSTKNDIETYESLYNALFGDVFIQK